MRRGCARSPAAACCGQAAEGRAQRQLVGLRRGVPRAWAIAAASSTSVVTWVTNVFVAATAISGPACRNRTASASRVMAEPTVFVTATTGQPRSRARRDRGDRVGGLARLRDRDDEGPGVQGRRAVAELRAGGRSGPAGRPSAWISRRADQRTRSTRCRRRRARPARSSGACRPDAVELVDVDVPVPVDPAA